MPQLHHLQRAFIDCWTVWMPGSSWSAVRSGTLWWKGSRRAEGRNALCPSTPHDPDGEQAYVREAALMISHIYEVSDNDDLRDDFDDLRSLTDYVRAMDR
jgi:hypothetical protein